MTARTGSEGRRAEVGAPWTTLLASATHGDRRRLKPGAKSSKPTFVG